MGLLKKLFSSNVKIQRVSYLMQPTDTAALIEYGTSFDGDIKSAILKLTIFNGSLQTLLYKDDTYYARFENDRCYVITKC